MHSISFFHTPCFCTGVCNQLPCNRCNTAQFSHSKVGHLGKVFSTSVSSRLLSIVTDGTADQTSKTLKLADGYSGGHRVLLRERSRHSNAEIWLRIFKKFEHCICAALYKVRCDPVQEGCDPGIDAWIAGLCTPKSKWYNTDQVETVVLGPHERSARVTL